MSLVIGKTLAIGQEIRGTLFVTGFTGPIDFR
jgi:hypothetical protein